MRAGHTVSSPHAGSPSAVTVAVPAGADDEPLDVAGVDEVLDGVGTAAV